MKSSIFFRLGSYQILSHQKCRNTRNKLYDGAATVYSAILLVLLPGVSRFGWWDPWKTFGRCEAMSLAAA